MYRGVTPEFLQVRRWQMRLGTFFTPADVEASAPVCVLGETVVENLFGNEDPVGKTVRIQSLPCKVIGVLERKGFSATGQDQDDFVVLPYTTVQKRITGTFWLDDIFCSAVSREAMPEATKEIMALLRERHHLNAGEDEDFNICSTFQPNLLRMFLPLGGGFPPESECCSDIILPEKPRN